MVCFSSSNERFQDITQKNDQLEHMLAAMTEQLKDERNRRIAAEALVDEEDQELLSIRKIVARYLANDVPSEQIRQTLNQLGKPSKCRTLENRDIEVVTPSFAGGESNRLFYPTRLVYLLKVKLAWTNSAKTLGLMPHNQ